MIIVCGFGRCGSSLVMQMLYEAGIDCSGHWPSFEDGRATKLLPDDHSWLSEYEGKALKVLDPLRCLPPWLRLDCKSIWLSRNPRQQAKSWAKVQRKLGYKPSRDSVNKHSRWMRDRAARSRALLQAVAGSVLYLDFERILDKPESEATLLAAYIDKQHMVHRMAQCVVRRPAKCLDRFLESTMVAQGKRGGRWR